MSLQFSRGDEEIAELFIDIGIVKNTARVLVLIMKDIELTSRDLERMCDLRQPDVSMALKDLMARKWVKTVRNVIENKGRPVKIYRLSKRLDDILDDLKGAIIGDSGRKIIDIERVRELLKAK